MKSIILIAVIIFVQSISVQATESEPKTYENCFLTYDERGNRFVVCPELDEQAVLLEDEPGHSEEEKVASTGRRFNAR